MLEVFRSLSWNLNVKKCLPELQCKRLRKNRRIFESSLSASTLEAPNFSALEEVVEPAAPARLLLPSEKVEEVRDGVGEGGLPPPDRAAPAAAPERRELVLLPTYIEFLA